MVQIAKKSQPDPVAEMLIVDAYMRWALEAAEEVVGKQGLSVVLRNSGLERFIDHYPPDKTEVGSRITFGDYAALSAGLLNFFGRAGKSMVMRVGRISARKGIEHQSGLFNMATVLAAKLMPSATQLKLGMAAAVGGLKAISSSVGQEYKATIEDRGGHYALIVETCAICAGQQADAPICWLFEALLETAACETFNKSFDFRQTACRAMGDAACIWEVSKTPVA
jgi:predicted hydrocarbon binding protein